MTAPDVRHGRSGVVVSLVVLSVLGLVGCRGSDRVAAPAVTTPSVAATPGRSAPGGSAGPAASADPLADVEASVDAVARDLDADADAGADRGR